jgi:hypothetical protein
VRCEQTPNNLAEFADRHGLAAARPLPGGWLQLTLFDETVPQARERLAADFSVIQPNYSYEPRDTPNDTRIAEQYAIDLLRLSDAWDITLGPANGDSGHVIAVIDNGVDHSHPDLSDSLWDGSFCVDEHGNSVDDCVHGFDFADEDKDPAPVEGHGTHVAGIIAATSNNSQGITGVSRSGQIMALRTDLSTAQIIRAINFATNNGARILNLSWGIGASTCEAVFDQALYDAIADFDGLVVVAAGDNNEEHDLSTWFDIADFGHDTSCWSALGNIISVTASDVNGARGTTADYGVGVDIAAPGIAILSTEPGNAYGTRSGSSMAAAQVAGTAALIWASQPDFGPDELRRELLAGADTISTDQGDMLRLNAYTSIARTAQPVLDSIRIFTDNTEQTAIPEGSSSNNAAPFFRWDAPIGAGVIAGYDISTSLGSFSTTDTFFDASARGLTFEVAEHEFYVSARNDAGGAGDALPTYFGVTAPTVEFFQSGNDVCEVDPITIQVTLSEPAAQEARVTVSLSIDDVPLDDELLTWDAGTSGIRSFTIDVDNDSIDGTRFMSGTLINPVNVLIGDGAEIGFSVFDNEPRIGVSITDTRAVESQFIVFDYSFSSPAEVPVSFDYQLTAESATPGADYTDSPTTIFRNIGNSTGTIVVPVSDDGDMEGMETFAITLSNLVGVQPELSQVNASATIVDDDIVLDLQPGWNLVGLPLQPDDSSLINQVDVAWYWDAGCRAYRRSDLSIAGAGHWVHVQAAGQLSTTGIEAVTPPQRLGWNLISPLAPNIAAPYSFAWDGAFTVPTHFELGQGYWQLRTGPGQ